MTLNILRSTNQNMDQKGSQTFGQLSDFLAEHNSIDLYMTPFDLYIKTLFASKRNQIYYKSSSTNISDYHQTYNYALQIKIYIDLK